MGLRYLATKPNGKPMYHKRDWKQYNKQLINRGKINFWITPEIMKKWTLFRVKKKNGRPFSYSDDLIRTMCFIRFKFHLSLRETEGFFCSLVGRIEGFIEVPSYTQLCRRMKTLKIPPEWLKKNVTDIVLDTTGLKVYGEGEWRAEKYGGKKSWRKLHLALDPVTSKLVLAKLSSEYVHDTTYLEDALQRTNRRKGRVLFDGIADSLKCYRLSAKYNKILLTPPKKGAVYRREPELAGRNDAIKLIRSLGNDRVAKSIWGKLIGYNRRVIAESMMARWKKLYGGDLKSRCSERQNIEIQLKAAMINAMIDGQAA